MQSPGTMPDGSRVQVPGTPPPHTDRGTLPSNPFPDNAPDVPPPQSTAPPAETGNQATGAQAKGKSAASAPSPAKSASNVALASPVSGAGRSVPDSLLNKPAGPAKVTINDGRLAVEADNSSLSQILDKLASTSGMKVDGLGQDQRIFGTYGPGNPRDVLTSLLDGANYNVLMVGATHDGAPRELILTPRSNAPVGGPQNSQPIQQDQQDDDTLNSPPPEQEEQPRLPMQPIQQQQNPNGTVKTPAQILQELQQMRQQSQQQQPQ